MPIGFLGVFISLFLGDKSILKRHILKNYLTSTEYFNVKALIYLDFFFLQKNKTIILQDLSESRIMKTIRREVKELLLRGMKPLIFQHGHIPPTIIFTFLINIQTQEERTNSLSKTECFFMQKKHILHLNVPSGAHFPDITATSSESWKVRFFF